MLLDWVWTIAISSNNRFIASGSQDKSIQVFDMYTKQRLYYFADAHSGIVYSLVFSNDGHSLFSGGAGGATKKFTVFDSNHLVYRESFLIELF